MKNNNTEKPTHKRYSIAQEMALDPDVEDANVAIARKEIDKQRDEFYSKLKEKVRAPEGKLAECFIELQSSLTLWFRDIGITNELPIPPNSIELYLTDDENILKGEENVGARIYSIAFVRQTMDIDYIFEYLPPENDETREQVIEYLTMINAAHELYHATSVDKYNLLFNHPETIFSGFARERSGLHYATREGKKRESGNAYEEGLAIISENRQISLVLNKKFPLAASYFAKLFDSIEDVRLYIVSDGENSFYPMRCIESTRMVVTLHNLMRDAGYEIEKLEEEARLNHKTLQLARAIDKVCGRGMYLKIAAANEKTAPEITAILENIRDLKLAGARELNSHAPAGT